MKKHIFLFLLLISFVKMNGQQLRFQNQDIFLNGVNVPWNGFGWDFGEHHEWGRGYDSLYFENIFIELEAHGVNSVRMWVHCDGRANPNFDKDGFVTGLDEGMLEEMDDFLERAKEHNILVIFTLWSHDFLEDYTNDAGEFAGLHQDLIIEVEKTQSYLDKALAPMVQHLNHHCNLLAWEVVSEPEWCMSILGGGTTQQRITAKAMQTFVGKCIQVIRENSSQMVTVGSAYPCGNDYDTNRNYWHETEFEQLGFDCESVNVDFYSFHFFEWMNDGKSVFEHDFSYWDVNKPIVIAESAVKTADKEMLKTGKEQLDYAVENNYAGVMFWSVGAGDEYSDWSVIKDDVFDFSTEKDVAIEINCDNFIENEPQLLCRFYPNPAQDELKMDFHVLTNEQVLLRVYDLNGRLVRNFSKELVVNEMEISIFIGDLMGGIYLLEIWQERGGEYFKVFVEKVVKM